jgi:hypothetical protein
MIGSELLTIWFRAASDSPVNTEFDYLLEFGLDIDIRFMLILQ